MVDNLTAIAPWDVIWQRLNELQALSERCSTAQLSDTI